jgi:hypothetical protein
MYKQCQTYFAKTALNAVSVQYLRMFQRKSDKSQLFFHPQVSFLAVLKAKNELQANKSSLKYVFIMRCSSLSKIFLSSNPLYGVRDNIKS